MQKVYVLSFFNISNGFIFTAQCSTDLLIDNGNKFFTADKKVVAFHCFHGFRLIGSASAECMQDGTWSSPPPECAGMIEYKYTHVECKFGIIIDYKVTGTSLSKLNRRWLPMFIDIRTSILQILFLLKFQLILAQTLVLQIVLTLQMLMIKEMYSVCVDQDTEQIYQILPIVLVSRLYNYFIV